MHVECKANKAEIFICLRNAVMCGSAGQVYKMVKEGIFEALFNYLETSPLEPEVL